MTKRIGIFGDSFGVETPLYSYLGSYDGDNGIGKSWVSYFREYVLNATVTSHALQGSCLYYSYDKFLKHKHEYDTIIFIFTSVGRLTKTLDDGRELSCVNIGHARRGMENYKKMSEEYMFYSAMKDYFTYIQDYEKDAVIWDLMYRDIISHSNVFSIRAFDTDDALIRIHREEDKVASDGSHFEDRYRNGILDIRFNHITDKNNKILASDIHTQLQSGQGSFTLDLEKYSFNQNYVDKFMVPKSMVRK